ncbi:hypothetical protein [Lactiplantibacillus plantarum]|uniref:hypothetical protein n=1 Tax=Lactiplantibacillus plantarum TaxID=1590 RepID=UPI00214B0206|nr:hypothetical protein [Lactiplantibacillus plantarum]
MEFSVSDEYDFFNDCLKQFLGVELPSVGNSSDQEEEEDPKIAKARMIWQLDNFIQDIDYIANQLISQGILPSDFYQSFI